MATAPSRQEGNIATLITLVDNTVPVAADFNSNFQALNSETRPATSGGTGQSTYVTGDLLYASASNVLSRLAAGSTGTSLTMTAGVPAWGAGNASHPSVFGLVGANNVATPTSKYDLLATLVTLRNPTTGSVRTVAVTTLSNDIAAATTTNGRDQAAAFSTSSWIYLYYVGTGSGSATTLSSASSSGPTLLTNQTEWALATALFQNSTPAIVPTVVRGRSVFYNAAQSVLSASMTTSVEASVSVSLLIPPIAQTMLLHARATHTVAVGTSAITMRYAAGTTSDYHTFAIAGTAILDSNAMAMPNVGQQFFYQSTFNTGATGLIVDVMGYTIANGDV